jgi:hypothetical protein
MQFPAHSLEQSLLPRHALLQAGVVRLREGKLLAQLGYFLDSLSAHALGRGKLLVGGGQLLLQLFCVLPQGRGPLRYSIR